jgi:DNA polymerase-1
MEGFFYKEEIKTKKKAAPKVQSCSSCGLYKNCKSPKMSYHGQGRLNVLAIAMAPGQKEDEQNKQLVGEVGQELRKRLKDNHSIVIDRDWYKTNALICKLAVNQKEPTNNQINACRHHLLETIDKLKPKKIICFGQSALQSLIGQKESITSLNKWTGWKIPDQDYKAWVYVNYHPAFLLRNEKGKIDQALSNYFDLILREAIEHDEEFPIIKPEIKILYNENEIRSKLDHIISNEKLITFDYETTGLRPYRKGHRIVCVSIATDKETIVFPFKKDGYYVNVFKELLHTPKIKKVAQNMKFEDLWSEIILGVKINNWYWDTMLATHIIDNRAKITRLKFQTYVNFGYHDYSREVAPFLEFKKGEDIYGFNDIDNCNQEKLLYYCGLDSYFEHKLYHKQLKDKELLTNLQGYDLLHQGTLRLKETEKNGFLTNQAYFKEKYNEVNKKIMGVAERIKDSKENKIWKEKEGKSIDINSPTQLKKLLFTYCEYKSKKQTKKGNDSTDEEALEKIGIPFTKNIIRLRKYQKINNTYIKNFISDSFNSFLHSNINLHSIVSYRSSYDHVNLQNVPKHDEKANTLIRTGLIPRSGRKLIEIDYKGSEIKSSACYHHDPVMINYINDKTTDMHRDTAIELFLTTPDEVDKKIFNTYFRYWSKNNFVFAEFYGDWYKACARNIWQEILKSPDSKFILNLLKEKGIKNYYDFEENARMVEDNLWNNRFKVYSQWKLDTYEEYLNTLQIKLLTGFTCRGYMSKNDVLNYQIQGTSFHFLLWSYIRIADYLKANKFETMPILEIHDSILLDVVPDEEQEILKVAKKIMCEDIRKYWKWIIVPLDIEVEATKINGNWAEKEEIKI